MTHDSEDRNGPAQADLVRFVQRQLPALSEAFAQSPLMQLRISTPQASVHFVKARAQKATALHDVESEPRRAARASHEYLPNGEPGRAYETVSAEVVGVFHAAPDLPAPGEQIEADRVLGYIEALKLRTPVKAGLEGRLVGQVAEDGQPVDFGETLFVVDSGPLDEAIEAIIEEEAPAELEPPRI